MDVAGCSGIKKDVYKRGRKPRQPSGDSTKSEPDIAAVFSESDTSSSGCTPQTKNSVKRAERNSSGGSASSVGLKFSSLAYENGFLEGDDHKSAFLPYKPRTILTNLQRGNVQTETVQVSPAQLNFQQRAGKGELTRADIEREENIDASDVNGLTPLMWAAAYGQAPTATLLLRAGADYSLKGRDGETALHLAAAGGHTEIIRILISAGASINEPDDNCNTPLMYAAHGNHAHAVNELLNNSADLTASNLNDDTALSIAVKCNCREAQTVMEGYLFMLLQPS